MRRAIRIVLTLLAISAFAALLLYGARSEGQVECRVCISFGGQSDCQASRGADQKAALQGAQAAACAGLTRGVTDAFRCQQTVPQSSSCQDG